MNARSAVDYLLDPEIVVFLVLGTGLTAAYFDLGFAGLIFALGFAVLLPLSDILSKKLDTDEEDEADGETEPTGASGDVDESAALETLRERYARGEIDEMEYERRLEDLLATESVGEAREYVERRTGDGVRSDPTTEDRELERERR